MRPSDLYVPVAIVGAFALGPRIALAQVTEACAVLVDDEGEPLPNVTVANFDYDTAETGYDGSVCLPCADSVFTLSSFHEQLILPCVEFAGVVQLRTLSLPEITITGGSTLRSGRYTVNAAYVENAASIIGESDLLRTLQMLPGVSGGAEGQVAPTIRGGSKDQTLVLLDGATLYNPSHAVGFLGAINTDYVRVAEVYKSNFPTRYGGRLSGLVDVSTRTPESEAVTWRASVGFPNASATVEGPVGQTRHLLSVRASYPSLFLLGGESALFQGDGFYKAELPLKRDRVLSYRLYANRDNWTAIGGSQEALANKGESNKVRLEWGNVIQTVRFSQSIADGVFEASASASTYLSGTSTVLNNGNDKIKLPGLKSTRNSYELMAEVGDVNFAGGAVTVNLRSQHANTETFGVAEVRDGASTTLTQISGSLGVEYIAEVGTKWSVRVGGRAFVLEEGLGDYRAYLEPRVSAAWKPNNIRVDFAYDRMTQDVHVVTAGGTDGIYEMFLPPTDIYGAPSSEQVSIGIGSSGGRNELTWLVEAYVKRMDNLVFVPSGVSVAPDLRYPSPGVERQDGRAYGVETSTKYGTNRIGDFNLSYALSKSERIRRGTNAWHDDRWDRPHALNISHSLRFGDRWRVSSSFVYESGYKFSVPAYSAGGGYFLDIPRPVYTERYGARGPAHHRLDIALSRFWETRRYRHNLTISFYNVYGRRNPFSLYYAYQFTGAVGEGGQIAEYTLTPTVEQASVLRFVPGLQYRIQL